MAPAGIGSRNDWLWSMLSRSKPWLRGRRGRRRCLALFRERPMACRSPVLCHEERPMACRSPVLCRLERDAGRGKSVLDVRNEMRDEGSPCWTLKTRWEARDLRSPRRFFRRRTKKGVDRAAGQAIDTSRGSPRGRDLPLTAVVSSKKRRCGNCGVGDGGGTDRGGARGSRYRRRARTRDARVIGTATGTPDHEVLRQPLHDRAAPRLIALPLGDHPADVPIQLHERAEERLGPRAQSQTPAGTA